MAASDLSRNAKSLQIVKIKRRDVQGEIIHELELNEKNLKQIMEHPDVEDNKVMVVSIAGALRKGKSFLLGFFLKYLEAQMDANWLNDDDTIQGFEWRNCTDVVTYGIQIWSKPFIFRNSSNEKVAVLLMDTQGVFDCKSTKQDCANIFTLSNLISSVQMYNLMHQIQEDDLENLEYFIEFGKLVQEKSEFQDANKSRLIFLIRDWGCPSEFPYGNVGGEDYVRKQLKEEPEQHPQLLRIRANLNSGLLEIGGFLLPYPGKDVATSNLFVGRIQDIDREFLECVKLLVPYVVSEEKLIAKQMNCKDVKGKEMLVHIKQFVKFFNEGDYNSLETAVEATAAEYRRAASVKAYKLYKDDMKKLFSGNVVIPIDTLKIQHDLSKERSLKEYSDYPRIKIHEHELKSIAELESKIEDKYCQYEKNTIQPTKKITLKEKLKKVAIYSAVPSSSLLLCGIGLGAGSVIVAGGAAGVFVLSTAACVVSYLYSKAKNEKKEQ